MIMLCCAEKDVTIYSPNAVFEVIAFSYVVLIFCKQKAPLTVNVEALLAYLAQRPGVGIYIAPLRRTRRSRNRRITAPTKATIRLVKFSPVACALTPGSKLNMKPPMKAPTMPTMMSARRPIGLCMTMLANQPAIAPKMIHAIMLIRSIFPSPVCLDRHGYSIADRWQ